MPKPIVFQITEVYREEVSQLLSSRNKSKVIHSSGDIDASGDEVEVPFRDLLRRRLPNKYFVGHGHVVDKNLHVSPQFDVIIADNNSTPILFESENGTQYFPWESVYAVGEVKSSYSRRKRPVGTFADNVSKLKGVLQREWTPPNYLGGGVTFGEGFTCSDTRPFKNPLFQFIVFFDSGDCNQERLSEEYCSQTDESLPIAVFLDGKVVVKAEFEAVAGGVGMGRIDLDPLNSLRTDVDWTQIAYTSRRDGGAQALVVLMLGLFDHLERCILMRPPIGDYLNSVISSAPNQPDTLTVEGMCKIARVSGDELPKEYVKFLRFRAANGKSPYTTPSVAEVQAYCKKTGVSVESISG
jgi:hypothetical protein